MFETVVQRINIDDLHLGDSYLGSRGSGRAGVTVLHAAFELDKAPADRADI